MVAARLSLRGDILTCRQQNKARWHPRERLHHDATTRHRKRINPARRHFADVNAAATVNIAGGATIIHGSDARNQSCIAIG